MSSRAFVIMDVVNIIVIFIVTISTLVVLSTILGVVWEMPDIPEGSDTYDEICLPALSPDGSVGKLGCRKTTDHLSEYLRIRAYIEYNSLLDEYNRPEEHPFDSPISLKQYIRSTDDNIKPAARLIGQPVPKDREDNSPDLTTFREWYPGRELHYHGGFKRFGIRVRNGRLVVPVSGLYDVYSFVVFYEPCKPETGEPDVKQTNQSLKHAIFKFDILEGRETEIIHSVQPLKVSANRYNNVYNSYTSAVVNLKAGDEVSVKVSNITYLSTPSINYFGLNLL